MHINTDAYWFLIELLSQASTAWLYSIIKTDSCLAAMVKKWCEEGDIVKQFGKSF